MELVGIIIERSWLRIAMAVESSRSCFIHPESPQVSKLGSCNQFQVLTLINLVRKHEHKRPAE
jgi:hypothetical protein